MSRCRSYRQIDPLDVPEKAIFLQSVYLAHLMTGTAADVESYLSNTAHLTDLAVYTATTCFRKVLLIRDPVEIVLSRTCGSLSSGAISVRGDRRRELSAGEHRACGRHREVEPENYDLVVRYEDLLVDPVRVLEEIAGLIVRRRPERLRRVAFGC